MRTTLLSLLFASTAIATPAVAQNLEMTTIPWDGTFTDLIPGDIPDIPDTPDIPDDDPGDDVDPADECPRFPFFEDMAVHSPYYAGDSFISHGVHFTVAPFQWSSGTWYNGGKVYADNANRACGTGQDLFTNNANVQIRFRHRVVHDVYWMFGEYGGNVNIEINGDFRNVNDYRDLDGMMVGGVLIHVLWGGYGNDCGCILLDGAVQKLAVGGQEHWMDCLRWKRGLGPHNPNWNPRDGGDVNRDGKADVHDLMAVLAKYGTNDSDADLDASGSVDVRDLLATLRGIAAGPTPHPDPAGIAPLPSP